MSITFNEDANLVTKITPDKELYAVFEGVDYEVIVGDSAKIEVGQAINYIKSGKAEIQEGVDEVLNAFNANATEKTNAFNINAENKLSDFNSNALNKTNDFNSNASDKTTAFNNNAISKTGDFNDNAVDKTNTFNSNASDKTTAFNNNYTDKKDLIDAQVAVASGYADTAKQWAIGEPSEPEDGSAKYWAEEAGSLLSGVKARIEDIEEVIPSGATSSNQLTDKSYVDTADSGLQSQIDALVVASDVFDIVGTYAELQAYDISTVPVNDIIKVLVDETHSGAATYYRCVESGGVKSWSYIGSEGAYYTKSEADSRFATPSDIGNATITLTQGGVPKGTFTTNQSGNATIDVDAATIPSNMVTTDTAQTITELKTIDSSQITDGYALVVKMSGDGTQTTAGNTFNSYFAFNDTNNVKLGEMNLHNDSAKNNLGFAINNPSTGDWGGTLAVAWNKAQAKAYAYCPTPFEDTNNSTQIDTVGARNTKLQNYALSSSLATVATSGNYNDLSNKPTIPTVNNATLTIQKNGTTVKTFTANASTNVTANITVPTKTSDITNDSGFITGITSSDVTTALGYTPANDSNVVKTSGNQTIGGTKTFTSNVTIKKNAPSLQQDNTSITKGTAPSSNANAYSISYRDNDGKNMGALLYQYSTNKDVNARLYAYKSSASTDTADVYLRVYYNANGNHGLLFNTENTGSDTNESLTKNTTSVNDTTIPCMGWVNSRLSAVKGNVSVASPSDLTSSISIGTRYTFANNGLFVLTIQVKGQTNPAVEVRMSDSNNASSSSQIITIFGENGGSSEYFQGPFIFPVKKGQSIYLNKTGTGSASIEKAYLFSWNNS